MAYFIIWKTGLLLMKHNEDAYVTDPLLPRSATFFAGIYAFIYLLSIKLQTVVL
jgi:hypothetical protein